MPPPGVLITFYSLCGTTERLALEAALGAVEARASIRLRRLPEPIPTTETFLRSRECQGTIRRLDREYVAPTDGDVVWADAVVFCFPGRLEASSEEVVPHLTALQKLADQGKLVRKIGTVFKSGESDTGTIEAAILELGFQPLDPGPVETLQVGSGETSARSHGRRTAEFTLATRSSSSRP